MLSYLSGLSEYADALHPLRLLRYISFRVLLAAGTAFVIGVIVGPWLIARFRSLKMAHGYLDDRTGLSGADYDQKKFTPTMGGLIIFVAVLGGSVLWAVPNVWVVASLFVYAVLTVPGWRDDYLKVVHRNREGIRAIEKILWQSLAAAAALALLNWHPMSADKIREFWVPFIKSPLIDSMPWIVLGVLFYLWIVGFSNAINLTDGLDGLAVGCTISVALVFGIMAYAAGNVRIAEYLFISYVPGTGELAVVCGALIGAGMAFLWFNAPPAEVFMGDTGSLALGGLIGVMAFMIHQPLTLVIVGGVFVLEAGSVILQVGWFKYTKRRFGQGRRIFLMSPLHHHFQKRGWKESKIVVRFWVLSLIFALAGLATLKLR
jgi:phospho-N-acetylmuramoyl-pentapeptide-transferase